MEISLRQFHLGKIGHALSKFSIPVGKSHLPKCKMARRVAAPIVSGKKKKGLLTTYDFFQPCWLQFYLFTQPFSFTFDFERFIIINNLVSCDF